MTRAEHVAAALRECGLDARGYEHTVAVDALRIAVPRYTAPAWLWPCPECDDGDSGGINQTLCEGCNGSGRRGPQRKPPQWWWDVLEGVRCVTPGPTAGSMNVGWLKHPHDALAIKRIAKPGEAAYPWLVLTMKDYGPKGCIGVTGKISGLVDHIYRYTLTDWARALAKEQE